MGFWIGYLIFSAIIGTVTLAAFITAFFFGTLKVIIERRDIKSAVNQLIAYTHQEDHTS